MKRNLYLVLALVMLASLVLAACASYTPPEGYFFVGTLSFGDGCETPSGYVVVSQGNFTGKGNVDLTASDPENQPLGIYTLNGPENVYAVDRFIFVNLKGENVSVYAPAGQVCTWSVVP